jgi:hypothetical protein
VGEAAKVVRGGCRRGEMNEVIAYSIASAAEDGGEMAAMDVEYKKLLLQVMIRQQLQG